MFLWQKGLKAEGDRFKAYWKESMQPGNERYSVQIWYRFAQHKLALLGLLVTLLLIIISIIAPWIAPYNPSLVMDQFSAPPSANHWLGTDQVGRDVLSRLIYATRISMIVGFGAVAIYVTIGTVIGLVAGYFGGWIDMIVMRVTDVIMSFPYLIIILVVVSVLGSGLGTIVLVLSLFSWPTVARLVRGSVMTIRHLDYVQASIVMGMGKTRILFRQILPNTLGPIIVNATFGVAGAILSEAGLSFLGMGIQPPIPSWGNMLTDAQSFSLLTDQPWLWLPAGIMLLITVLAINFVGDGLRDAFDPK
ncbi:oligopeptide ABC transporter permease [Paenibacillus kyungheensis]